ncbi:hypothetical protein Tco_0902087, partial [Tanacetum coccineum]
EIDQLDAIPISIQSLLNRANSIIFLIEEFTGELAPINPIPPRIVEADPEKDILLIEKLLNDNSSPHSPEEHNYEIPTDIIKSFSPSPIPVEDSDSFMEEKSPHLLSHRGFKNFQLINDSESLMMIYGKDIPILDVPYLHFYPP